MKIDGSKIKVNNNEPDQQFEVELGPWLAKIQYRIEEGVLHLLHTEVPNQLKGHGIAGKMARRAVSFAHENDLQLQVWCPFLQSYFKKYPDLLEK